MADHPRDILKRLGLSPKHSWGQNFLSDEMILERIAEEALLRPGEPCVELGPGLGHLTRQLLATGAKVTAVERDRDMVRALNFQKIEGLTIVEGNAAECDFAKVANAEQVVVVGNLPYHLSSQILFEVLEQADHVPRAVFTLQKEVVERLAADPGNRDYGVLTVLLGLRFKMENVLDVPAELFHPPPKVDSAVLKLTRLDTPRAEVKDEARFRKVVKAGFAQRRKTLSNSLKSEKSLEWSGVLEKAGIDGGRRAETLSVEEFAAIERALG
ncbi:MAG: 16S rRNA (adenine(1518)-N(6)/adenine(1519)-N(6))-dimethyltransferase [Archangium gephyra]|uniref:Ribosomal RNA small subunit methyltransferase A n=1 Tax=Archangium gephyra TaxID=48 RepID=A0A2W5T0X1_9BACT|nr:MAG: 16S rRNA (adenine(1518)-N(6)/adenine(1519)-N(6))-dimethyltransferase [Archangium gephyra]